MNCNDIKLGMRVKTNSQLATRSAFTVQGRMIGRCPDTEGVVRHNFAGAGELWRVLHNDGTVGVYSAGEFEPVQTATPEAPSGQDLAADKDSRQFRY